MGSARRRRCSRPISDVCGRGLLGARQIIRPFAPPPWDEGPDPASPTRPPVSPSEAASASEGVCSRRWRLECVLSRFLPLADRNRQYVSLRVRMRPPSRTSVDISPGQIFRKQVSLSIPLTYRRFLSTTSRLSRRRPRDGDRVPICGVSRAIAGTAGHPCQANATLARPLGQPPPRLSCRRPASPRARTPRSAPAPRASSTRGRARAWR